MVGEKKLFRVGINLTRAAHNHAFLSFVSFFILELTTFTLLVPVRWKTYFISKRMHATSHVKRSVSLCASVLVGRLGEKFFFWVCQLVSKSYNPVRTQHTIFHNQHYTYYTRILLLHLTTDH